MKVAVTEELVKKVLFVHKKGLKPSEICGLFGISPQSASRIVCLLEAAERGDFEKVVNYNGENNRMRLKKIILNMYAQPNDIEKCKAEVDKTATVENSKIVELLEKQNELLDRLCKAWQA